MEIVIKATPKEIADLAPELQSRLKNKEGGVNNMANVNPNVKKIEMLIECKPNQEKEIPLNRILRHTRRHKQRFPNAEITIKGTP